MELIVRPPPSIPVEQQPVEVVDRIGQPIDDPQLADVRIRCDAPPGDPAWSRAEALAREHVRAIPRLWRELVDGRIGLDRWPLRQ
jgi:S-adenosylmethionine synthetase